MKSTCNEVLQVISLYRRMLLVVFLLVWMGSTLLIWNLMDWSDAAGEPNAAAESSTHTARWLEFMRHPIDGIMGVTPAPGSTVERDSPAIQEEDRRRGIIKAKRAIELDEERRFLEKARADLDSTEFFLHEKKSIRRSGLTYDDRDSVRQDKLSKMQPPSAQEKHQDQVERLRQMLKLNNIEPKSTAIYDSLSPEEQAAWDEGTKLRGIVNKTSFYSFPDLRGTERFSYTFDDTSDPMASYQQTIIKKRIKLVAFYHIQYNPDDLEGTARIVREQLSELYDALDRVEEILLKPVDIVVYYRTSGRFPDKMPDGSPVPAHLRFHPLSEKEQRERRQPLSSKIFNYFWKPQKGVHETTEEATPDVKNKKNSEGNSETANAAGFSLPCDTCRFVAPHLDESDDAEAANMMHEYCSVFTDLAKRRINALALDDHAKEGIVPDDVHVIYFHTLGSSPYSSVSAGNRDQQFPGVNDLRQVAMDAVLSPECLMMPDSCNMCGARFSPAPYFHYPGNIFAAKCSYIAKLVDPIEFRSVMFPAAEKKLKAGGWWPRSAESDQIVGRGQFAMSQWAASHPSILPCEMYDGPYSWSTVLIPRRGEAKFSLSTAPRYRLGFYHVSAFKKQTPRSWFSFQKMVAGWAELYGVAPAPQSWIWKWFGIPKVWIPPWDGRADYF